MLRTRSGKKCQPEESPPKERGDWENHHHPDSPGESFQKAKLGKKEKTQNNTQIKRFCSMHLQDGQPPNRSEQCELLLPGLQSADTEARQRFLLKVSP